jgi:hypothetical protein
MGYKYYNPNPLGLSVGDCTIRAISKIIERDWKETYLCLLVQGYQMYDMPSANRVWGEFLRSQGFVRRTIPDTYPDCYTVKDFCIDNPTGTYILGTGEHVIAVVDGDYYDSWDSGREIPVYYFERQKNGSK